MLIDDIQGFPFITLKTAFRLLHSNAVYKMHLLKRTCNLKSLFCVILQVKMNKMMAEKVAGLEEPGERKRR